MKKRFLILLIFLIGSNIFALDSKDIKLYQLKNSIPVYIVKNSNSIDVMNLYVRGGASELKKDESGYKDFLYSMILYNNLMLDSVVRGDYQDESGTKFSYYSGYDFSRLTVTSIDEYFDKGIDYLTAMICNPIFKQDLFNLIKTNKMNEFYTMIYTPDSLSDYHAEQFLFKDSAYKSFPFYTEESLEKLNVTKIKNIYESEFTADKICIIIRTNADADKIIARLNKTIGALKTSKAKVNNKPSVINVQKNSIVKTSPELQGTSILCRYYKAPATNTREFLALLVAGSCYDKMLSSVLRGKYGICYSSGNVTTSRLINYGQDIIYSCSDFNDIKQKIIEVQQILLSGKYICSLDGDKEFVFEELSEVLEGFKNSQLIRFYTANRSSVEILDHVYISLMYFNNPVQIYSFYEQINYLTQEEILNAFKKYIITDDELWVGITSSELEDKLSAELSK
ncbi:MAG: hypothetical protein K6E97_02860 [Treponema sp.]|nr:hypothetical protein [Treponema sp.]